MNIKSIIVVTIASFFLFACKEDDDATSTPPVVQTEVKISSILASGTSISTVVNPSGIAPLTAELKFQTRNLSSVEITVMGAEPVYKNFDNPTTSQVIPVLGLYPGVLNKVAIKITTDYHFAHDTLEIQTDSLPSVLPSVTINTKNEALMEPGMNLNTLSITDGSFFNPYPLIYDKNGDIRWFLNLEGFGFQFAAPMERISNGNLLFETADAIKEYDMMGREHVSIAIPAGYHSHHDIIKLPNGNYVVAVLKDNATVLHNGVNIKSYDDHILEMNSAGQILTEWDIREVLDVDRDGLTTTPGGSITGDWFHMNAIYYSSDDNCLIISGQKQGVIKVDWQNNLKWILSPHKGWEAAGHDGTGPETKPFLLTALDGSGTPYDSLVQYGYQSASDFDWAWGQHAPLILPNGNILLFDNGNSRNYQTAAANYSRAVEYEIDENNMTVKEIWEYGKSRGEDTYSVIISDVDYLENTGNVLFCPGIRFVHNYSKIVELAYPGGTVVFEGTLDFKNERSTGGGFGQFDLTYRASRLSLYP